ncbi:hypothetical protein CBR_g37229 [Chara braunii]|uniref:MULE transposase domain-containing protein n=1 Tax=Chara braunii TaxID=69332 RepID=A0A388LMQ7_CHABU|nr:hypothetical protein CBR_g37229 [Chara braunii]|eukprot:GBG83515.1 hypothetical protein CBR_g37229 [Chara braunii]
MAQLRDYLHTAVPAPLMDARAEVVDLHAFIARIDHEFKTQRYDDIDAPLLYIRIQIGEATCSALIDCGASRNYISQDFIVRAGLGPPVQRKSQPTQVTLADGHTHKSIDRCIDAVPVYFAPHANSTRQTHECDTSTPIHVDASLPLDNTASGSRAAPTPSSHGLRTTITTSLDMPCGIRERVESATIDIIGACTPCASDFPSGNISADGSHDCDIGPPGDTYDDEHAEIASLRRYMAFRNATFVGQRSQRPPKLSDSGPSTTIPAHDRHGRRRRQTQKQPSYESSDREAFTSGDDLTSPYGAMWRDFRPLEVGGRYESMDALRDAVVFCDVASGFEFRLKRSNKTRYHVTCAHPDCPWTLEGKAAHANGHTEIVRLTPHRPGCRQSVHPDLKCKKHAKQRWVELMVEKKLREDIGTTSTKLKKWFDKAVKTHASYNKCLRARTYVLRTLNGPPEDGFSDLRRYCRVLHETNPGSIIDLECEGNVFVRMFFALAASVTGFAHCRPLIVLDGANIRGKYEGCLLGATDRDANGQCFPLAYAIVDGKRKTHWKWFLVLLKRLCAVAKMNHKIVTIMSDWDKGLIPAVSEEFGDERHTYCVRHVSGNLLKSLRLKKEQAAMLLEAARATCEEVFDYYMQRVTGYSRHKNIVDQIFDKADKRHWGGPHFVYPRYGKVISSVAESMNSKMLEVRGKPPIPMLEGYRGIVQTWHTERREKAAAERGRFPSVVEKILRETVELARKYEVRKASLFFRNKSCVTRP